MMIYIIINLMCICQTCFLFLDHQHLVQHFLNMFELYTLFTSFMFQQGKKTAIQITLTSSLWSSSEKPFRRLALRFVRPCEVMDHVKARHLVQPTKKVKKGSCMVLSCLEREPAKLQDDPFHPLFMWCVWDAWGRGTEDELFLSMILDCLFTKAHYICLFHCKVPCLMDLKCSAAIVVGQNDPS